jgi:hypothetical protein
LLGSVAGYHRSAIPNTIQLEDSPVCKMDYHACRILWAGFLAVDDQVS